MTPEQRRWKWVKYEYLPDDMKPFFKDKSGKQQTDKQLGQEEKRRKQREEAGADAKTGDKKEVEKQIVDDQDLDFTVVANVDMLIIKYRNQLSISRRNYDLG